MNNSISEHIYQYGTKIVNYNLVRSRRVKTCEIIINDENTVVIRSPYSKPISEIEGLLKNKMNWISRKQIEYKGKEHRIEIIRPTFQNNSTVPYLGRNLKLNIIQSYSTEKDAVEFKSNQLFAFIKTNNMISASNYDTKLKTRVKLLYEKWLARQANDVFMQKVFEFSKMIKVNPNKIIIKNLKNRWGSATEKGIINLNINLLKAPEHVIDYIIIHELCHLKIKKHSHHFWYLLRNYIPDYKDKLNWLEINGTHMVS
jgi:predicted metal-dependent hydrolase